ncbi:MAG: hypothetical protein ACRDSR_17135 [Pseudonocardiaceae bacterium]
MDRRLRRAVLEKLAAVEEVAIRAGAALSGPVARKHIQTITDGWRELLIQHQPDPTGRCPVCSGWLRRRRWPCEVWNTAHWHLVGGGAEPLERAARKSHPFRRPRQVLVVPRQLGALSADKNNVENLSPRRMIDAAPAHQTDVTEPAAAVSRLRREGHPPA